MANKKKSTNRTPKQNPLIKAFLMLLKRTLVLIVVNIVLLVVINTIYGPVPQEKESEANIVPISTITRSVKEGSIDELNVNGETIVATHKDKTQSVAALEKDTTVYSVFKDAGIHLEESNVKVTVQDTAQPTTSNELPFLPTLLLIDYILGLGFVVLFFRSIILSYVKRF